MNYQNQNEPYSDEQGSSRQQPDPSSTSSASAGNEMPSSSRQPRDYEDQKKEDMKKGAATGDFRNDRNDEDRETDDWRNNETRINNEGEFDDNQGRYRQGDLNDVDRRGLSDEDRRTTEEDSEEGRRSGDASTL